MTAIAYVAIDISKTKNDVLIERTDGSRRKLRIFNKMEDYLYLESILRPFIACCKIGLEPTSNYHRPIAFFLTRKGYQVSFIPSIALARTREALYNSWDKNDPKDAQVMIHMLKLEITHKYHDPVINGINDIQELSGTHFQVSKRKTKLQHNLLTHYLPLYFPEVQKYFHSSRAENFFRLLLSFPTPSSIIAFEKEDFIKAAWDTAGRKVNKTQFLSDFYETAQNSIGIPIEKDSVSMQMFQLALEEVISLEKKRKNLEKQADHFLGKSKDYQLLKSIPGVGPIIALTILAESGDLRRFKHHRQYLKFCGFDLSTQQSGQFKGSSKLSKRGNARLRYVFWLAAGVAIRMTENTFREKYSRYIRKNPDNPDLRRKAMTATAAKLCRVAHGIIKNKQEYRPYFDEAIPRRGICSTGP